MDRGTPCGLLTTRGVLRAGACARWRKEAQKLAQGARLCLECKTLTGKSALCTLGKTLEKSDNTAGCRRVIYSGVSRPAFSQGLRPGIPANRTRSTCAPVASCRFALERGEGWRTAIPGGETMGRNRIEALWTLIPLSGVYVSVFVGEYGPPLLVAGRKTQGNRHRKDT